VAKSKPLSLPNVTRETIAAQAYRLFGSLQDVAQAQLEHAEVRRQVAERGVDPGLLAKVLEAASADPHARADQERVFGQYVSALRVPTLRVEAGFGDLLSEQAEETDDERRERITDEGFWAYLMHRPASVSPYPAGDEGRWWNEGYEEGRLAVEAGQGVG
jgi:hypothetical protein